MNKWITNFLLDYAIDNIIQQTICVQRILSKISSRQQGKLS